MLAVLEILVMHISNMTNKRAKKILDFLARKIRFSRFSLCKNSANAYLAYIVDNKVDNTTQRVRYLYIRYPTHNDLFKFCVKNSANLYAEALEQMLEHASLGRCVVTNDSVFLPAYSTIEQIEIEIELEVK